MSKITALATVAILATTLAAAPASAAPRKPAIASGADRVAYLQRADAGWEGTWYWYVGNTYNATNLTGVTALGLLEAYRDGKDARYLDAARSAAAFAMAHLGAGATTQYRERMTAPDIVLLHRLAQVTGDASYAERASKEWDNVKASWPTAGDLDTLFRSINRQMGAWDLAAYLEAAYLSGDTAWADGAAAILANTGDTFHYGETNPFYALNVAGALRALAGCGYAGQHGAAVSTLLSMLVGTISTDNVGGGVQDTAYGVMALVAVGGPARAYANDMARWLTDQQQASGGWTEPDGREYAEVDGEAVRALALTIGTNVTVDGFEPGTTANAGWRASATRGAVQAFDSQ